MKNNYYLKHVSLHFDLTEEIKATVWTAQSFIEMGILTLEEALEEFNITKEAFNKYKAIPQS